MIVIVFLFCVIVVYGLGISTAMLTVVSRLKKHGVIRYGVHSIVGSVDQQQTRRKAQPANVDDMKFRCGCGGAPLTISANDPRLEPLMLACEHVESCRWLNTKISKTLERMS